MTADLMQFLRARFNEDEATTRATTDRQPYDEWDAVGAGDESDTALKFWSVVKIARMEQTPAARDLAHHIARYDPVRILAEVEAKRRILDECAYWHEKLDQLAADPSLRPYPCHGEILDVVTPILRALSLPYSEHPNYRDEWRPLPSP